MCYKDWSKGQFLTTYKSHLKIFRSFLSKVADRFKKMSEKSLKDENQVNERCDFTKKFASRHAVLKLAMHRKRKRQPNVI